MAKQFLDKKVDGLSGVTEHVYYQVDEKGEPTSLEIYATQGGLHFRGRGSISNAIELSHFAYVISEAWKKHQRLNQGLKNTLLVK
jgi:hypothetical protein